MARHVGSKNLFHEEHCDECKKLILFSSKDEYIYKLYKDGKRKWYCSYKCWRKAGGGGGI